jgi:hypothetical protein
MMEVLEQTGDLDETARKLADEYGQPLPDIARDLQELCEALQERSLVVIEEHEGR